MHLSFLARGVLGLQHCGVYDHARIAVLLSTGVEEITKICLAISKSKNSIVTRAKLEGLPSCASVPIAFGMSVRCPECRAGLCAVPCAKCAPGWSDHYAILQEYETEEEMKEPEIMDFTAFEPTDAMPGTIEKMNAMRQRLNRGLPIYHPRDKTCFDHDLG
jgi:hypothetical protein